MKLLIEFVSLFLESPDRFKRNVATMKRLLAQHSDSGTYEFWIDLFAGPSERFKGAQPFGNPKRSMFNDHYKDLWKAPQMHERDIIGLLGAGAEGVAFELDDGTVFKIGDLGHADTPKDVVSKFRQKHQRRMRGVQRQNDLVIHDVGRAHMNSEKLIPFIQWLERFDSGKKQTYLWAFEDLLHAFAELSSARYRAADADLDNAEELEHTSLHAQAMRLKSIRAQSKPATDDEINKLRACVSSITNDPDVLLLADAFANELDNHSGDLHAQNLGVRIDASGKPTFVFYDF